MNPHPEATVRQPSMVPTTGPHGHAIDPMPATVIHIEGPPLDYLISHWQPTPQQQSLARPPAFNAPTFVQPTPLANPSGWHTSTVDPTWFEAFDVSQPPSAKPSAEAANELWRAATPYHGSGTHNCGDTQKGMATRSELQTWLCSSKVG